MTTSYNITPAYMAGQPGIQDLPQDLAARVPGMTMNSGTRTALGNIMSAHAARMAALRGGLQGTADQRALSDQRFGLAKENAAARTALLARQNAADATARRWDYGLGIPALAVSAYNAKVRADQTQRMQDAIRRNNAVLAQIYSREV